MLSHRYGFPVFAALVIKNRLLGSRIWLGQGAYEQFFTNMAVRSLNAKIGSTIKHPTTDLILAALGANGVRPLGMLKERCGLFEREPGSQLELSHNNIRAYPQMFTRHLAQVSAS